jgi:hypothetical protein
MPLGAWCIFMMAALLEVGGDAVIRKGLLVCQKGITEWG